MPQGSDGNAQPAPGACAVPFPASAPAIIVAENRVRSILSSRIAGSLRAKLPDTLLQERKFCYFIILTTIIPTKHDPVFVPPQRRKGWRPARAGPLCVSSLYAAR
jgi:hypothetical protein